MLEPLLTPVLNRLLRSNSWAPAKLAPHAGKVLAIESPPFLLRFRVSERGELEPAERSGTADTTITVAPSLLLRFVAREETAWKDAVIAGDTELAAAIDYLRRHLVWDYEEDLSRVFGDIAAHRMAAGLRSLDQWGRSAAVDLGRAFAEYAAYESPLIASPEAIAEFLREVDVTRDDVERLEKRIEHLMRRHAVP